jgi:hypothetical protein
MRAFFLSLLFLILSKVGFAQNQSMEGCWVEYKRTLRNGEGGSKYTLDGKPFVPSFQIEFGKDSNKITIYDGKNVSNGVFILKYDTLIIEKHLQLGGSVMKDIVKFKIIKNNTDEIIIEEYKDNLDDSYFVRRYYFNRNDKCDFSSIKNANYSTIKDSDWGEGGKDSLYALIYRNIKYPQNLLEANVNGKVFVKITITKNGEIQNAEVMANPRIDFAYEAMRVIKLTQEYWKTLKIEKTSTLVVPIDFKIR